MTLLNLPSINEGAKLINIKVEEIAPVPNLSSSDLEVLLAQVPILKDSSALSSLAIEMGALLHPPIVWRPKPKIRRFVVIGNARTVELYRNGKARHKQIPVVLVKKLPAALSEGNGLKVLCFLSLIWYGIDASSANNTLNRLADSLSSELLTSVAPGLESKSGREKLLGLNRRHRLPLRGQADSPTSQKALSSGEEGSDVSGIR